MLRYILADENRGIMLESIRVSIPIEKHYGFITNESGIVVDHFGPVSIIQLDNGDRRVIIDDNFY